MLSYPLTECYQSSLPLLHVQHLPQHFFKEFTGQVATSLPLSDSMFSFYHLMIPLIVSSVPHPPSLVLVAWMELILVTEVQSCAHGG